MIEHPATRIDEPVAVANPEASPVKAFQTIKLLLTLEFGGHGAALISARTELQRIDAHLFRHYMSRREAREV